MQSRMPVPRSPSGPAPAACTSTGTNEMMDSTRSVALTSGVMSLRRPESRIPTMTWHNPVTATSAASVPGPPSLSAMMQNGTLIGSTAGT